MKWRNQNASGVNPPGAFLFCAPGALLSVE
jgi:hypothetical protein